MDITVQWLERRSNTYEPTYVYTMEKVILLICFSDYPSILSLIFIELMLHSILSLLKFIHMWYFSLGLFLASRRSQVTTQHSCNQHKHLSWASMLWKQVIIFMLHACSKLSKRRENNIRVEETEHTKQHQN